MNYADLRAWVEKKRKNCSVVNICRRRRVNAVSFLSPFRAVLRRLQYVIGFFYERQIFYCAKGYFVHFQIRKLFNMFSCKHVCKLPFNAFNQLIVCCNIFVCVSHFEVTDKLIYVLLIRLIVRCSAEVLFFMIMMLVFNVCLFDSQNANNRCLSSNKFMKLTWLKVLREKNIKYILCSLQTRYNYSFV